MLFLSKQLIIKCVCSFTFLSQLAIQLEKDKQVSACKYITFNNRVRFSDAKFCSSSCLSDISKNMMTCVFFPIIDGI